MEVIRVLVAVIVGESHSTWIEAADVVGNVAFVIFL